MYSIVLHVLACVGLLTVLILLFGVFATIYDFLAAGCWHSYTEQTRLEGMGELSRSRRCVKCGQAWKRW